MIIFHISRLQIIIFYGSGLQIKIFYISKLQIMIFYKSKLQIIIFYKSRLHIIIFYKSKLQIIIFYSHVKVTQHYATACSNRWRNQINAKLSRLMFVIGSRQRWLQTVARKVAKFLQSCGFGQMIIK